jgi:hypothetical protein
MPLLNLLHLAIGVDFRFLEVAIFDEDDQSKDIRDTTSDSMEECQATDTSRYKSGVSPRLISKDPHSGECDGLIHKSLAEMR